MTEPFAPGAAVEEGDDVGTSEAGGAEEGGEWLAGLVVGVSGGEEQWLPPG
ncbi:MAG: hypothetical protein WBG41_17760 [Acidimicrobiales bacterium]